MKIIIYIMLAVQLVMAFFIFVLGVSTTYRFEQCDKRLITVEKKLQIYHEPQ